MGFSPMTLLRRPIMTCQCCPEDRDHRWVCRFGVFPQSFFRRNGPRLNKFETGEGTLVLWWSFTPMFKCPRSRVHKQSRPWQAQKPWEEHLLLTLKSLISLTPGHSPIARMDFAALFLYMYMSIFLSAFFSECFCNCI